MTRIFYSYVSSTYKYLDNVLKQGVFSLPFNWINLQIMIRIKSYLDRIFALAHLLKMQNSSTFWVKPQAITLTAA